MTTLPERLQEILVVMREAQKEYAGHHSSGTFRRLADRLEAAQALQAALEGGWVLVPREPTEEMIEAAATAPLQSMQKQRQRLSLGEILKIEYAAMLYAAPSPTAALQAGEV